MTRPELSRRLERTEEDLIAISDTVLEIKDTVDQHTGTLAGHGRELVAIKETVGRHTETLAGHGRELAAIREVQAQHGEMLTEILRRLDTR